MQACLERAIRYLTKAATLWPRFTEILYTQAKCHALLGQNAAAQQRLQILSDRDRRFFAKANQDGDFEAIRDEIAALFNRATTSPGPLARATQARLAEVGQALAWAKRSAPGSEEDLTAIESIEGELASATRALPTLNVDIEDLSECLTQMEARLDKITQRALKNNIDALGRNIASLDARKSSCESSIEQLKKAMEWTSGAVTGCLVAILFFFGSAVLVFALIDVRAHENVPVLVVVPAAIIGGRYR
jgi:chromosome segregation ATPase